MTLTETYFLAAVLLAGSLMLLNLDDLHRNKLECASIGGVVLAICTLLYVLVWAIVEGPAK